MTEEAEKLEEKLQGELAAWQASQNKRFSAIKKFLKKKISSPTKAKRDKSTTPVIVIKKKKPRN